MIYQGNIFNIMPLLHTDAYDLVIADPDYSFSLLKHHSLEYEARRISKNWVFIYGDKNGLLDSLDDGPSIYSKPDQLVIWEKDLSTKANTKNYYNHFEVLYIWGGGKFPKTTHWSQKGNVWHDKVDLFGVHKWRKPLDQMMKILRNHTEPGQTVLDLCAGSAPMRDACNYLGRWYVGIDIDYKWCDRQWSFKKSVIK